MHRIPNIFAHSSNRRRAGADSGESPSSSRHAAKPKRRLDRRNAMRDINYEYSPSSASASSASSHYSSEESLRTRSLDLYGGKTSFRVDGVDGEIEILCKTMGFSGIDDLSISPEDYEAMKVRSSSAPVVFGETIEPLLDRKMEVHYDNAFEFSGDSGGVEIVCSIKETTEVNDNYVEFSVNSDDVISRSREQSHYCGDIYRSRANDFGGIIGDSVRVNDVLPNRSNEYHGNGIKGVRPPVLAPPPSMSLPVIDKECSTWDMFRLFGPDGETSTLRSGRGLDDEDQEDRRRKYIAREENCVLSGSCSFTTNDDDSSSTTTEPLSSISPNRRFRRVISEWQKCELLGRGSFGSVYEGISE